MTRISVKEVARQAETAISMRSPEHFILVKQADHTKVGAKVSARVAAEMLLDAAMWPLWSNTPCKLRVSAGDHLAVYLAGEGNQIVFATAIVKEKVDWKPAMANEYPLCLSGIPVVVLRLQDIVELREPIHVRDVLHKLSFVGPNRKKWGVRLMGGMRSLTWSDFRCLTTAEMCF